MNKIHFSDKPKVTPTPKAPKPSPSPSPRSVPDRQSDRPSPNKGKPSEGRPVRPRD